MSGNGFINDWYISLDFSMFRDYRIVKMADAQGNVREGIFLPFIQNGIKFDVMNPMVAPKMVIKPYTHAHGNMISKLIPYANKEMRKKMVDAGVIAPNDIKIFNEIGTVMKDFEFITHRK